MTGSLYQLGLGSSLGDDISAVLDITSNYCIFSVIDGGWRKNVPVDITTCEIGDAGYISSAATTWTDITAWNPNPEAYWVENLTGCGRNLFIYFNYCFDFVFHTGSCIKYNIFSDFDD